MPRRRRPGVRSGTARSGCPGLSVPGDHRDAPWSPFLDPVLAEEIDPGVVDVVGHDYSARGPFAAFSRLESNRRTVPTKYRFSTG